MNNPIKIGLFGYGVVGHGVYDILINSKSLRTEIIKICAKHPEKKRDLPMENFTFNKYDLLDNPEVDLIVELIDDAEAAFEILKEALLRGKNVVTSNKKMLAEHLQEIYELQKSTGKSVLYEGSSCGSIPIIRTLEEYYDNEMLNSVSGIFNASTNYILTRVCNENKDYDLTVQRAQDLGLLESNPTLDIVGFDALYKLAIISAHAYGYFPKTDEIVTHGIQNINKYDVQYAKEKEVVIKHVAHARKVNDNEICLFVLPQFVSNERDLSYVNLDDNAVEIEASFSQNHFFKGKGAGSFPTGSSVVSDISALTYNYKYAYKKRELHSKISQTQDVVLEVYFRYYDKRNLAYFQFEKITEEYKSEDNNYVVGHISLKALLAAKDRLNTADIFMAFTGKIID